MPDCGSAEEPDPVPHWFRAVYSSLFWLFLVVTSVIAFPIALTIWALTVAFDRRLVVLHQFTCFWAALYTWCNPAWPVTVRGREHMQPDVPYVMVANHLSIVDIFVVFRLFRHFKWVSKIENFRLPFIGWNMHLNRYIPLRRGDRESVVEMFGLCRAALEAGNPIMMFPEGTRSKDGRLKSFKPGAFELALENGCPILPMTIEGSGDALPKKGVVLQGKHPIRLTVLPPIDPADFGTEDPAELSDRVRALLLDALGQRDGASAA